MRVLKLFAGTETPDERSARFSKKNDKPSADPDGLKPGQRYGFADQRARERMMDIGGDEGDPDAWERVALSMKKSDPRGACVAYAIGAREAGSLKEWKKGERLARASTDIDCSFRWTSGVDMPYRIDHEQ